MRFNSCSYEKEDLHRYINYQAVVFPIPILASLNTMLPRHNQIPLLTIIFSFSIFLVHGLKIPGKCPEIPTQHFDEKHTEIRSGQDFGMLLIGVPFSEQRPSHLFVEGNSHTVARLSMHAKECLGKFCIHSATPELSPYASHVLINDDGKGGWTFNSTVYNTPSGSGRPPTRSHCHSTIVERVRVWYDTDYLIIWACIDNATSNDHEEALLVATKLKPEIPGSPLTTQSIYFQALFRFRRIAGKYLIGSLIEAINWSVFVKGGNDSQLNPFQCPGEEMQMIGVIVGMLALFLVAIGLKIWGHNITLWRSRSRVMPVGIIQ